MFVSCQRAGAAAILSTQCDKLWHVAKIIFERFYRKLKIKKPHLRGNESVVMISSIHVNASVDGDCFIGINIPVYLSSVSRRAPFRFIGAV